MDSTPRNRRRIRLDRTVYSDPNRICSVTFCTFDRAPIFARDLLARVMTAVVERVAEVTGANVVAYCVMPDHVHLVASPSHRCDIVQLVGRIKANASREIRVQVGHDRIWQRGFWDHVLRRDEDVERVAAYVVDNPVRAGLVSSLNAYPYWGGSGVAHLRAS